MHVEFFTIRHSSSEHGAVVGKVLINVERLCARQGFVSCQKVHVTYVHVRRAKNAALQQQRDPERASFM